MKRIASFGWCCVLSLSLAVSAVAVAQWSEPELLIELNDFENGHAAENPSISSDELSLYFLRGRKYQMEATRENKDAPFTSERIVSELGYSGRHMFRPWVSKDHLSMYYSESVTENGKYGGFDTLKMALRDSTSDLWMAVKMFSDIHVRGSADKRPSLTDDGCTMMWISDRYQPERHIYKIWVANRPTIQHEFSNVTTVTELNDIGAIVPFLSPDGLVVYFSIRDGGGAYYLWMGSRPDMVSPFGDFEPIDGINQYGITTYSPCISSDGKTLYFFQRQGDPSDLERMGIFVSHWVDHPFDAAVNNLDEAIVLKTEAAEMIDAAMEKETQALEILAALPPEQTPEHLTRKQLHQARIDIMQALQRQVVSRDNLRRGLVYLNNALLGILPPVWIEEAVEPSP